MQVEIVSITSIQPYDKNAKLTTEKEIKALADVITRFGFRQPIHVDESGEILAGHRRLLAAKHLKLTQVPIIRHADLSEAEKKAWRIADNKIAEGRKWERSLLADELLAFGDEIPAMEIGFDEKEIAKLFDLDLGAAPEPEPEGETGYQPGEPQTTCRSGDIWDLGAHQLQVGPEKLADADALIEAWQKKFKAKATLEGRTYDDVKLERTT